MRMSHQAEPAHSRGFTLVELLAVIGIMILLAAFGVPALNSLTNTNRLNLSVRLVSNLMAVARSEAINAGVPVQLRVVTDKWQSPPTAADDTSGHFRKISLWKYDRTTSVYAQFSKWETLPDGVVIEPAANPSTIYTFPSSDPPGTYFLDPTLGNFLPAVNTGSAIANFVYLQFNPTGALNFPVAVPSGVYLLMIEGVIPPGKSTPLRTHGLKNWAQIRVASLTGRINVVRVE